MGGENYLYDENGNLLTVSIDNQVTTYTWNVKDELEQVVIEEEGVIQEQANYQYDINGNRIFQSDGTNSKYFVFENFAYSQTLAELDEQGQPTITYVHGHDLIQQTKDNQTHYFHTDAIGSTRALTGETGLLTDSYQYDAYGELIGQTGDTENSYLYTGEYFDPTLEQYYLRSRWYDPNSMRFTQMDGFAGTINKYAYVDGNPVNMIDPSGNITISSLSQFGTSTKVHKILTFMDRIESGLGILDFMTTGELPEVRSKHKGALIIFEWASKSKSGAKFFNLAAKRKINCKNQRSNSFIKGTLVSTEKGLIPIEQIMIGDQVWSWNEQQNKITLEGVTNIIEGKKLYYIVITLDDSSFLKTTGEHPFYVKNNGWINASDLKENDFVRKINGYVKIIEINIFEEKVDVYNLTVDNNHTYFVSQNLILTHNTFLPFLCNLEKLRQQAIIERNKLANRLGPYITVGKKYNSQLVIGAYDLVNGRVTAAISGAPVVGFIHPLLTNIAKQLGTYGQTTAYATNVLGGCAEFHAANYLLTQALLKGQLHAISFLRFTPAVRTRKLYNQGMTSVVDMCGNCRRMFPAACYSLDQCSYSESLNFLE